MATRMAPREGTGLEGMRLSVLSDWLGARSLALVPAGESVLVAEIGLEETERRYERWGLRRGVVVRCEENRDARVKLRLPSGLVIALAPDHSWFVQVTAPPGSAALNRRAAAQSRLQ